MPQRRANVQQFYFSRREILEKTVFYKQCKKCIDCTCAEYVDFEVDRKMFYTSNEDVKDWKIRWQGRIKKLVISPVF